MGAEGVSPLIALGQPGLSFRYVQTFGVTEEPYLADSDHLYGPNGMFVDGGDNLYVTEEYGYRMLKFDSAGTSELVIGHPGQPWHHDDFLSYPKDVALDGDGNIWVVIDPAIRQFAADGSLLQIFPEIDPWIGGDENDRFSGPRGIAFDSAGLLYISDAWNHRIQVYDLSGGTPVYTETIGETGVSGSDNAHFNEPSQIAFDSSDRLYVMDTGNYRVQRCEYTAGWSCSTFFGATGIPGDDLTHLQWASGITIDGADDIFIADGANYRILKCDTSGSCAHFAGVTGEQGWDNDHFWWPADVAEDSVGDVYVSDWDNHRVQKFDSNGTYIDTLGATRVPYLTDTTRLNRPWGITVAPDGSLYVAEDRGDRLIKLSPSGTQIWTVGEPGVYGNDDDHLGSYWAGPEGNLAIDSSGTVYVADTGNARVQIFDPSGTFLNMFGHFGQADTPDAFWGPRAVAIDSAGRIFVSDTGNKRIVIFDAQGNSLGSMGSGGVGVGEFDEPVGLAVNAAGRLFVDDAWNQRIQVFEETSPNQYEAVLEWPIDGWFGQSLENKPYISLGPAGQVCTTDPESYRVLCFGEDGDFLYGWGEFGEEDMQFSLPAGIALDSACGAWITDSANNRVMKFVLPGCE